MVAGFDRDQKQVNKPDSHCMRESLALTYSLNDRLVARDSVRKRACVAYRRINNSVRLSFVRDFEIDGLLLSVCLFSIVAAL